MQTETYTVNKLYYYFIQKCELKIYKIDILANTVDYKRIQ